MDREDEKRLAELLAEARLIRNDELKDADQPLKERDEPRGQLNGEERRIYTLILHRLEAMTALTEQTNAARASGQVTKELKERILDEFVELTNDQTLLNSHLGDLLHERLGIPADLGIAIRQGWRVIEVPILNRPQPTVLRVDRQSEPPEPPQTPDDDPFRWN